jgi:hypothetical protein
VKAHDYFLAAAVLVNLSLTPMSAASLLVADKAQDFEAPPAPVPDVVPPPLAADDCHDAHQYQRQSFWCAVFVKCSGSYKPEIAAGIADESLKIFDRKITNGAFK